MPTPVLLNALLACPPAPPPPLQEGAARLAEVDQLLGKVAAKYGTKPRKYEGLAHRVERAVTKALAAGTWGLDQPLAEHPAQLFVEQLEAEARAVAKARKRRNPERQAALLERYPWESEVEYARGLHFGSDRPVPDNDEGFIRLGQPAGPFPGYPELLTNLYLFGLQEIVDWQFCVKTKKGIAFEGRGPKDPPVMGTELSSWEALRVYLLGDTPQVPLFAVPQLTHRLHARLAEHRAAEVEGPHPMDEGLAFLDARWDGYSFEAPYTDELTAVVFNAHDLFTDSQSFPFRFSISQQLHSVGDMPFICTPTNQDYGRLFHDQDLEVGLYNEPYRGAAVPIMASFQAASVYLARYKTLLAQLVRAVASPHLAYPAAMAYLDYPGGRIPSAREDTGDLDVPRAHAVLVWAAVGKDPEAYADWLYEHVLSSEDNRFPGEVSLATAFTLAVRARTDELLAAVAERTDETFQREFSPYAEYLSAEGEPRVAYLLASFHAFHSQRSDVISAAARELIADEID